MVNAIGVSGFVPQKDWQTLSDWVWSVLSGEGEIFFGSWFLNYARAFWEQEFLSQSLGAVRFIQSLKK